MKKICVVTGTRAEYGLLKPLINRISNDNYLELQLYVTGAHLSPEFGLTYQEIEDDSVPIARKIEMLLSADTPGSIVKSMGVEMLGLAEAFAADKPDMIVLLGDRYEIMSAATAAMIFRIPIAHIHGGELTEGVIDESIRHSITKMSYLHFTATEEYRKRVIQLGEHPGRVYNVGALGVESICKLQMLKKEELELMIGFHFDSNTAMVTYHPVTLDDSSAGEQFENLLQALDNFPELKVIFTKANSDTDGRVINELIDNYALNKKNKCVVFNSLGQLKYLSALKYCSIVIGNSSSGIIEVPSFHIATVNIGDRQRGRLCADSVINTGNSATDIMEGITHGLSKDFKKGIENSKNPYEQENTSENIVNIMKQYITKNIDIKKAFFDL